jgi:Rod binding domain-containing protein
MTTTLLAPPVNPSDLAPRIALAAPAPAADPAREAALEFESVFLSTILDRMFASLPTDGPFGGGQAEATYRSLLAGEYAGALARTGSGIGIADTLYAELIKLQEAGTP